MCPTTVHFLINLPSQHKFFCAALMERINEEQNCQIAELTAEVNWITVHCLTYIKSAFLMLRINTGTQ